MSCYTHRMATLLRHFTLCIALFYIVCSVVSMQVSKHALITFISIYTVQYYFTFLHSHTSRDFSLPPRRCSSAVLQRVIRPQVTPCFRRRRPIHNQWRSQDLDVGGQRGSGGRKPPNTHQAESTRFPRKLTAHYEYLAAKPCTILCI